MVKLTYLGMTFVSKKRLEVSVVSCIILANPHVQIMIQMNLSTEMTVIVHRRLLRMQYLHLAIKKIIFVL